VEVDGLWRDASGPSSQRFHLATEASVFDSEWTMRATGSGFGARTRHGAFSTSAFVALQAASYVARGSAVVFEGTVGVYYGAKQHIKIRHRSDIGSLPDTIQRHCP
jgi:hypothetical protein